MAIRHTRSGKSGWLKTLILPTVPDAVHGAFHQAQLDRVLRHVPMIYAVASLNIVLIILVCREENLPFSTYGWMGGLLVLSVVRMVLWVMRARSSEPVKDPERLIMTMSLLAIAMMVALSTWTTWSFATDLFGHGVLIPVSLCFGATCVAHCLAPIRTAAVGVLAGGILPVAVTMALADRFESQMLGMSMLTIAVLMIRFVSEHQDQLVTALTLEQQIREQANTDALTGLANRRAIMAALETEENAGRPFGLALLDLDGFKAINDAMGHHAGDILLQEVGNRLTSAALPGDVVGRLGGDEFVVMFSGAATREDASGRATVLLSALCTPMDIDGEQVAVGASLGFAVAGADGRRAADLLLTADRALYAAKRENRKASTKAKARRAA